MLVAIGDIYVRIPDREPVRELMQATQERARAQPGCSRYVFAEVVEDPGHFTVTQEWSDRSALEEHYRGEAFKDYQAAIGAYLVRTSDLLLHEVRESVHPVDAAPIDAGHDD
jgi:quinol monooxygenase YgiN